MEISHADHDYLKLKTDPLEKYLSVFQYKFVLNIAIFTFTMRSTFTFLHSETDKTSKSGILEMLPPWYILSLKPKEKGYCKHLIHLISVSLLFIFLI